MLYNARNTAEITQISPMMAVSSVHADKIEWEYHNAAKSGQGPGGGRHKKQQE